MDLNKIKEEASEIVKEIIDKAGLKKGDLFVVGCSSSEVHGAMIGTESSVDIANAIYETIYPLLQERGIEMAAQCCEHLNRALVVERRTLEKYDLEEVNVVPQPKAGGSWATCAYEHFDDAVLVENLRQKADAGLDIGGTLIGMHIHPVVVPLRLENRKLGEAIILGARRRPKFVGGQRAKYDESLM